MENQNIPNVSKVTPQSSLPCLKYEFLFSILLKHQDVKSTHSKWM